MEELPLSVKIIGLLLCAGVVVLLATYDKLIEKLRRAPRVPKAR